MCCQLVSLSTNISKIAKKGFLGSFLSKSLKTNQLEVNTDERTLRPIARLKEPRDLFALPKDRDHDCPQQAARWPSECQVLDERVCHIEYVPEQAEPYYQPTGSELRPRPVGEENGVVVYNYNPVSAVNYKNEGKSKNKLESDDSDSESSSESRSPTPDVRDGKIRNNRFSRIFMRRSSSKSNDEELEEEDCSEMLQLLDDNRNVRKETIKIIQFPKAQKITYNDPNNNNSNDNDNNCSNNNNDNDNDNDNNNNNDDDEYSSDLDDNLSNIILNDNDNDNLTQFSRSSVGGSKFLMNLQPYTTSATDDNQDLEFESRFESGNLAKAVKITSTYYELYLRPDLYTNRHKQWFYFRVTNTKRNVIYRFSIVNLVKADSLYNEGMRPLMYSTINASIVGEGWRRCGDNISYYKNDDETSSDEDEDNGSYTLTFNIQFPNDADTVYFAHSYPYTYSDLQDYLMEIQRHPVKSKFCKLRLLCRSLAGNNVYYLTVTAPTTDEDANKKKRAIIISARVHPGETPSSWMMKGLMDFITGDSYVAKRLRHKFIFKLIPMLNPDGVIVGNTRSSLTGKDLNRQYRTVIRETYPSIWYTKAMIKRLIDDSGVGGVAMYCDMHAHSRKHNIFIYGCENKRTPDKKLSEQVFPLMLHKNCADKFSFESCKFRVQRSKEGTGRIVVWMLGVTNSYTMEASFGGSTMGSRNGSHFSTADYELMGRAFCETLLDYYDDNPVKVKKRDRVFKRLKRIRKQERRLKKAARLKKLAEEGCILSENNILSSEKTP